MRASTRGDADTGRPCSNHVYHVVLTAQSPATSSRRRPGVRRRVCALISAGGGMRSRWERKKSPNVRSLSREAFVIGGGFYTRIIVAIVPA